MARSHKTSRRHPRGQAAHSVAARTGPPPDHAPPPGRDPRKAVGAVVLLACAVLVAYLPALRAGYIKFDDTNYIEQNVLLRSWAGLGRIWFDPHGYRHAVQYYPMTHTSFWIEYQVWGTQPTGYHVTNVGLHALNAVLVWLVLRRLRLPGALLVALLFAVHPVQVQSVAWIVQRKNVLSGFFALGALLCWLRFAETRSGWPYLLSVGLFLLGLLSKTAVCTLPVVLVLWVWWRRPESWRRFLLATLPFFGLALALGLLTLQRESGYGGEEGFSRGLSLIDKLLIAGRAVWFYAAKLVYPLKLVPLYPRWVIDSGVWWQYVFPVGAAGVAVLAWALRKRLGRGPLMAVLCFAVVLGPTLGLVDFGFLGHSCVSDHFQYLASISLLAGVVAVGTWAACGLAGRLRWVGAVIGVVVVLGLGGLTWRQSAIYHDAQSFWSAVAAENPSHTALSALGDVCLRQGDLDGAEELLLRAVQQRDVARTRFRLGELFAQRQQYAAALEQFRRARELNPPGSGDLRLGLPLLLNLGSTCWHLRDYAGAAEYFAQALQEDPSSAQAREWLTRARRRAQKAAARGTSDPGQPATRTSP